VIGAPGPDQVVWLDGRLVPWRDATVHVTAHHYGVGVFEGVRAYPSERGPAIFRLEDHTRRLFRSAHILGIPIPPEVDRACLERAQRAVVAKNGFRAAYIRPFVFYDGAAGLGLHTHDLTVRVAVVALEWSDRGAYLAGEHAAIGVSARTSSFTRHHPNGLLTKAKANGNYMNSILALAEARAAGADEALLLDQQGFVTEGSGANVFVVQGGALHTPPVASVLDGITRDTIMTLAAELGVPVRERAITRDEIYAADEAFLTGTAAEVTPIRALDGRRIGAGGRGALTERLQSLYLEHVHGRVGAGRGWLTSTEEDKGTWARSAS
jgi:branched-chain amino acid aminotransferase